MVSTSLHSVPHLVSTRVTSKQQSSVEGSMEKLLPGMESVLSWVLFVQLKWHQWVCIYVSCWPDPLYHSPVASFSSLFFSFSFGCPASSLLWAFSGCGAQGLFFIVVHEHLQAVASLAVSTGCRHSGFSSRGYWGATGRVVPQNVESSRTRRRLVSPALAGSLRPTVPPGKFSLRSFLTLGRLSSSLFFPGLSEQRRGQ